MSIGIFQVSNANQANPLILGAQVFSADVTLPNVDTNSTYANLFLATPLALSNGAYAFQLSPLLDSIIEWRRTSNAGTNAEGVYPGNTYAGGRAYAVGTVTGGGTSFNAGSSEFSLAVVAVPEPTTVSLVLASLGALYLGMRRRR